MNRNLALIVATAPLLFLSGCCEYVLIPEVLVRVTDVDGQPLEADVEMDQGDGLEPCEAWGEEGYACFGTSGSTDVFISAEGYESAFETVRVPWERCGTGSMSIDVVLDAVDGS